MTRTMTVKIPVDVRRALRIAGALAGLAIGGEVIHKIGQIREEYEKLNKEIDKVITARPPAEFRDLSSIEEDVTKAVAALALFRRSAFRGPVCRLQRLLVGIDRRRSRGRLGPLP